MPSKGVDAYAYICAGGCEVEFSVPGENITKRDLGDWTSDHLEVDKSKLHGTFNFTGQFNFKVTRNGEVITTQWADINTMTGNIEKSSMRTMFDQTSWISNELIITYIFYDAGSGEVGLPNSHQCYVVVSPNFSNWMGEAAPPGSDKGGKPFWRFALPAVHDVGMNSMSVPEALVQSAGTPFVTLLKQESNVFNKIADNATSGIVSAIAPNIISGLAVTQKDKLPDLLAIGSRYFEFRPARVHDKVKGYNCVPDEYYFTHGPIPGMMYKSFLNDVVAFLVSHPTEIIVVQLRWDGVPNECNRPNDDDLHNMLNEALGQANGSINIGNLDDMHRESIDSLRNSGRRLIMLKEVNSLSSYTDEANATLNGDSMVAEFDRLNTERQNDVAFTNIQCQATATNIRDVVIYSALSADVSNSCLMATKSICDRKTLPWIRNNALDRLKAEQNLVIMNDFFDGATADVAIELSKRRLDW
ncbi:PLC-like phosphodiesterase [Microthyrium microscopicum]|uniref:PLC-like phosphodiesterase n=1 Tax=Microthyrium microscopicum TaxID=703497 RepID=A0A6A6URD6_9PEZI|nr:PLC-like phosphodiesterase [Microthyrium microscopicum]